MKLSRTKDEMFMVCLCEETEALGEEKTPFDRNYIGTKVGLAPVAVKTICVLLARCNFIKKEGDEEISITPHGVKLVERLREGP